MDDNDDHNLYQRGETYWFRKTIGGREIRRSLHTTSKRIAWKKRDALLRELRTAEAEGRLRHFFVVAAAEFMEALAAGTSFTWAPETQTRYLCSMRAISRTIIEMGEDKDVDINAYCIDEIDVATVADLVARRTANVTVSTTNRDLTAFNQFMVFCKNKSWIDENPVVSFEKQGMKEVLPPITLPTDEAVARMVARGSDNFGRLIRFIDREGTRALETAQITWPDVTLDPDDPTRGEVLLRHTKGSRPRVIVLDPETVAMLRSMPRSNRWPYVFFNHPPVAISDRPSWADRGRFTYGAALGSRPVCDP